MTESGTVSQLFRWLLIATLVLALAAVIYIAITPQGVTDRYTEFYILGSDEKAADYPTNLTVGEQGTVIAGVTNHEGRETTYTILVTAQNETLATRQLTLDHSETRKQALSFALDTTGRHKVRFLLYIGTDPQPSDDPYRSLRLWVTVSPEGERSITASGAR